jgi:hypothetical protein
VATLALAFGLALWASGWAAAIALVLSAGVTVLLANAFQSVRRFATVLPSQDCKN